MYYEEKPNLSMKATTGGTGQIFPTWCIIYYVYVILHVLIWHKHNALLIDYGFKAMVADA